MPFQLMQLAEQNDIVVEYTSFQHVNIDAIYISLPDCQPVISLSKKLFNNHCHLRSVLAHEIGHYFTSTESTIITEHVYLSYCDTLEMSRTEYRAWRWAANHLIPTDTLKEIYSEDFCELWQLADFFEVDENVIKIKLDILKGATQNGFYRRIKTVIG
jgi:Zn-dependent peptidase ImmA (M78 family)